ncbi:MAG TPA: pantetheine-phosphate adenylyltransferase [Pirellulales bacterium]|jgi:pantetheine-phosphate adenylyltransferase|nr:pantetheine-phosphate adenylyltransferase [Pirellulales bacterium]
MTQSDMHIAVYTGSFDPITLGHLNVIERCSRLVGRLVIGIGVNIDKQSLFSIDERIALVRQATAALKNIEIRSFDGLAVDFVSDCRSRVMVRGVRSLSDMEAEFTMSLANRKLAPDIETVFLMAGEEYSHISSSLIKQIASLAGEDELRRFVPDMVATALRERLREQDES